MTDAQQEQQQERREESAQFFKEALEDLMWQASETEKEIIFHPAADDVRVWRAKV
jgi:hypothetical protein